MARRHCVSQLWGEGLVERALWRVTADGLYLDAEGPQFPTEAICYALFSLVNLRNTHWPPHFIT